MSLVALPPSDTPEYNNTWYIVDLLTSEKMLYFFLCARSDRTGYVLGLRGLMNDPLGTFHID